MPAHVVFLLAQQIQQKLILLPETLNLSATVVWITFPIAHEHFLNLLNPSLGNC